MKILVIGANGYIGSHLAQNATQNGIETYCIDNFSTSPNYWVHNFGTQFNFDFSSPDCFKVIKKIQPDVVFHFAARALVSESEKNPMLYYQENVVKTLTLINYCIQSNIRNFVFSSTCATFGNPNFDTINENHPQNPINTYGKTKLIIEQTLKDLAQKNLISACVFRYFNAAGCCPKGQIGENHLPETHLIPNICKSVLENSVLNIFGNDYETPDGTCIRDYVDVMDLVRTHIDGAHYLMKNKLGFYDFNLGTQRGHSVLEIVNFFESITNKKVNVKYCERRSGDPSMLVADSTKAKNLLNFKLQYSIENSIENCYSYLKKNK